MKPFLRWVGGKQRLVKEIVKRFPTGWEKMRYIEPFLGSGAVFLHVLSEIERWFISDANNELIKAWRHARPDLIREYGQAITDAESYKLMRAAFNSKVLTTEQQASLFVALNQTCFNGLWRVNAKGQFNVPYGKRKSVNWDDVANRIALFECANLDWLHGSGLVAQDYTHTLALAGEGDLVYLDPPYLGTFDAYTQEGFDFTDHIELERLARQAKDRGAKVIVSVNATHEMTDYWRADVWNLHKVSLTHNVAAKGKNRAKVEELIITSYPVERKRFNVPSEM